MAPKPNALERVLASVAPGWALSRMRARVALSAARHYEAAQVGRRTSNWSKPRGDANAANGPALSTLRSLARDLVRNNPWARRGLRVIANNTVGWGVVPKAVGGSPKLADAWKRWAETTDCDADGRLTFYGIQRQAVETIAESGEVLIRRRFRRPEDGLSLPIALQLLEPDYLDTSRDMERGQQGGPIIHGVEYDAIGRRVAYWLYDQHPGSSTAAPTSKRVSAEEIIHCYRSERPGQVRGVSWFAPVIVRLRDYDEYEDATIMRQKIAALFAAFVRDVDGAGVAIGEQSSTEPLVETLEPGLVSYLKPGQDVTFTAPPAVGNDGFSERTLRSIAAGLGVTFEDLTGDYSKVNFSSARMARLAHWANVHDWRWNMLIPVLCDGVWSWAMEAAAVAGVIDSKSKPAAEWTPPPMPMLEPDKEGLAYARLIRTGAMTPSEMVREQGADPETHFAELAKDFERLDKLGIVLDCDPRKVTQSGQVQSAQASGGGGDPANPDGGDAPPDPPADDAEDEAP